MIAVTVGYDLLFIVHLIAAIATVVVLAVMRSSARAAATGVETSALRAKFPDRTNWAARVIHVGAVTGVAMALTGENDVSFSQAWVGIGLALYLVLAFWLEARTLTVERELARVLASDVETPLALARSLVSRVDVALVIVAAILVTMVVQY